MRDHERINPGHKSMRGLLRVGGILTLLVGGVFLAIGLGSFFSAFGGSGPPRYFWCAFVGMPLLALGSGMLKWGFMGAAIRYQAGEVAPVAKDTFNYVAHGTQDGLHTAGKALAGGMRAGLDREAPPAATVTCAHCGGQQDSDARFCDDCGKPMDAGRPCPGCGEDNDVDARFCTQCGRSFA